MGKKSKRRTKQESAATDDDDDSNRAPPALRKEEQETIDNLRFEDPFIEEVEEDSIDEDNDEMYDEDDDDNGLADIVQAWHPLSGDEIPPLDQLEMDPTAYKMHHALAGEWPSLSFDFVPDSLGQARTRFPHSLIAAVGTQATNSNNNKLTIMKMSDLAKIATENEDDILGEEYDKDNDNSDDDDDDDAVDYDPIVEHYSINHHGGVNRVRVMPQQPEIVATWSDTGRVNLYNIEPILQRFQVSTGKFNSSTLQQQQQQIPTKPFFSYSKHSTEGYALDWSIVTKGNLASGDCHGGIHTWSIRPQGGYAAKSFIDSSNNANSIEDLQWSPTEATVMASAETNGHVRIFDTRAPNKAMLDNKISDSDVNVLSWNKLVANLLATGSDDGVLSVWDLRQFTTTKTKPLARFTPHKTPITSVEWHPTDESMLAVTDDHGAYVYDLSVEEDESSTAAGNVADLPPQLLFVHSGSEQFKEVHWHPQITSCLMTTALSGYSVFIPSNL